MTAHFPRPRPDLSDLEFSELGRGQSRGTAYIAGAVIWALIIWGAAWIF